LLSQDCAIAALKAKEVIKAARMIRFIVPPFNFCLRIHIPAAFLRLLHSLLCRPSDRPRGKNEDACSDEASDQIANPTTERDTEQAKQPASDCGPYDAEDDVHDKPHLAFHELLGEPASDPTNDDGCNPAYLCVLHGYLPKYVFDDTKDGLPF
jgi:hypothetical protein